MFPLLVVKFCAGCGWTLPILRINPSHLEECLCDGCFWLYEKVREQDEERFGEWVILPEIRESWQEKGN